MFIPIQNGSMQLPEIPNSLRFDGTDDYVIRYFPTGTSCEYKHTYSVWVKRTKFGAEQMLLSCYPGAGYSAYLEFTSSDTLGINVTDASSNTLTQYSSAVFRDPSAWYHIVMAYDTQNANQNLRLRIWVNNKLVVNPTLASSPRSMIGLTSNYNWQIGSYTGSYLFNGYMANACFVAGQSLDPSNFAYLDINNQWRTRTKTDIQAAVNSGGNISWFLPFDVGTSTTTLGADACQNGLNWTLTNMVRDGSVNDCWSYDTPTNNFSTFNPINSNTGNTFTLGALRVSTINANYSNEKSTIGITSGKWYAEFTSNGGGADGCGIAKETASVTQYLGQAAGTGIAYYNLGGVLSEGSTITTLASYTTNSVIGVALDADAGTVQFYKDGVAVGTAYSITSTVPLFFATSDSGGASQTLMSVNFGQVPVTAGSWNSAAGGYFRYTPPTGFKALCTKNLPAPLGAAAAPASHFDVKTHTGTGVTQNITGVAFQPDFVWIKCRSNARNNMLADSMRVSSGYPVPLYSDLTNAEGGAGSSSFTNTPFLSNGIQLSNADISNASGNTFVDWMWKAGGASVTNNAGSISSQVSANTAAGFSIVTYTGTGANATVGHGLNIAPKMVIVKTRTGVTREWAVYHGSMSSIADFILLSNPAGKQTDAAVFNGAPTSTVFNVGTSPNTNGSTIQQVAYCFAEVPGFSKIGSYTGNGSTDGPFVYCGFRPKYVMYKRGDAAGNWYVEDAVRNPTNVVNISLSPNLANVDYNGGGNEIDFLANGFKFRTASAEQNASGGSYIFMAFAESPFNYANAR